MPLNTNTKKFTRAFSFVDEFAIGDEVTREALDQALDDLAGGINGISALGYQEVGEWPASGAFPATRPDLTAIQPKDAWRVTSGGTVSGQAFVAGDFLVALRAGGGLTYTGNWLRVTGNVATFQSLANRAELAATQAQASAVLALGASTTATEAALEATTSAEILGALAERADIGPFVSDGSTVDFNLPFDPVNNRFVELFIGNQRAWLNDDFTVIVKDDSPSGFGIRLSSVWPDGIVIRGSLVRPAQPAAEAQEIAAIMTPFPSRAEMLAANLPVIQLRAAYVEGGRVLGFVRSATDIAATTADGATWAPDGVRYPEHFGDFNPSGTNGTMLTTFFDWPQGSQNALTSGRIYQTATRHVITRGGFDFDPGNAIIDGSLIPNGDFDTAGSVLRFAGTPNADITITSITQITNANRTVENLIRASASHGLVETDDCLIHSDDVVDIGHDVDNERRGQMAQVRKVASVLTLTGAVTLTAGEVLTQAGTEATGVVLNDLALADNLVYVTDVTGTFNTTGQLTGDIHGALGANSRPTVVEVGTAFVMVEPLYETLPTNPKLRTFDWFENFRIRGTLTLLGPGRRLTQAGHSGLGMSYCRNGEINKIATYRCDYQAVSRDNCRRVNIEHVYASFDENKSGPLGAVQYGDTFKNATTDCNTQLLTGFRGKHLADWTRNTSPGVGRNCRIGEVRAYGTWEAAVAMHGNARGCSIGYARATNCLYAINVRSLNWDIEHAHGENVTEIIHLTDNPRFLNIGRITGNKMAYAVRASDDVWLGKIKAGNINIGPVSVYDVSANTIHLDFSSMLVLNQTIAAVTAGTTTSMTVAAFAGSEDVDFTGAELTVDPDGAGSAVAVIRNVVDTRPSGISGPITLTWATPVGTAPVAGVATYKLRSFVDNVTIGRVVSHNCAFADVYLFGNFRSPLIDSIRGSHDTVTAQPVLWVNGSADTYARDVSVGTIERINKDGVLISPFTVGVRLADDSDSPSANSLKARADLIARKDLYPLGTVVWAGGHGYVKMPAGYVLYGTNPITDIPGWAPFGAPYAEHFGANGSDNVADAEVNRSAFEQAITYAENILAKKVNIGSGTFYLNAVAGYCIAFRDGIEIEGVSKYSTILKRAPGALGHVIAPIGNTPGMHLKVSNLTVDGNKQAEVQGSIAAYHCIRQNGGASTELTNLIVKNGIYYGFGEQGIENVAQRLKMTDVDFADNGGWSSTGSTFGDGCDCKSVIRAHLTRVYAYGNAQNGLDIRATHIEYFDCEGSYNGLNGINVRGRGDIATDIAQKAKLFGCRANNNGQHGINPFTNDSPSSGEVDIIGCSAEFNTAIGLEIDPSCDYVSVFGGNYSQNGSAGVRARNEYFTLIGAKLYGNATYGFDNSGLNFAHVVQGNRAFGNTLGDIRRSGAKALDAGNITGGIYDRIGLPTNATWRAVVTGSANSLTLTTGAVLELAAGLKLRFTPTVANTGSVNITLPFGTGPIATRTPSGAALFGGYLRAGIETEATYDGTYWVVSRETEVISNADGICVRRSDGSQTCTRTCNIDVTTTATQNFNFAAAFLSGSQVSTSFCHLTGSPNAAIEPNNVRAQGGTTTQFFWRQKAVGVSTVPGTSPEQINITGIGRWF